MQSLRPPHSARDSPRAAQGTVLLLPRLLDDIRAIVDGQSQTDPQFRTQRLYTRLSVEEVRRQLIAQKGYTSANCPGRETLRLRLNALGYYPQRVAKTRPKKRLPRPTPSSSG